MLLSIGILTYNHSAFIRQCLDSVLEQKVSFDYEIVVGDDASTDGTQDILQEYKNRYPDKFVLIINPTNKGIGINYQHVLKACKGNYIALCEGDDYWTDCYKLQKQVDFLNAHDKYGFVGTYNQLLLQDNTIHEDLYDYLPQPTIDGKWELYGNVFECAIQGPVTRTVSLCFRKSIIEPYMEITGVGNDLVLQTILAKHSLFAKYCDSMCMYRQGGISTDTQDINKQLYYNRWYVTNRLLQKQLFPSECNWNEQELADRETYILLKDAIRHRQVQIALNYKKKLGSSTYKQKAYSKYLLGPITCFILSCRL